MTLLIATLTGIAAGVVIIMLVIVGSVLIDWLMGDGK